MKNVVKILGAFVLAAVPANAQHSIQVPVPFEFAAAGQILPAGEYRVSLNESNDVVALRGQDLSTIFLLTAPGDQFGDERNVLRFQHFGNKYSLQGVVFGGMVRPLPSAKKNQELFPRQE